MSSAKPDQLEPSPTPDRRGLRFIHGLVAIGTMGLALPLACIGGMALVGGLTDNVWVRIAVPLVILVFGPLLLADRLLPKDPNERRPGLVRDVLAGSWAAAALGIVGLSGSLTGAPLHAEAARLEADGWNRAAWVGRWMAGPEVEVEPKVDSATTTEFAQALPPTPAEPAPVELASEVVAVEAKPAPRAEPEPEPESEPPAEPAPIELASEVVTVAAKPASLEPKPEPEPESEPPAEPVTTKSREYSPAELFSTYAPSVVSITIDHGGFRSGGTGFFIDNKGTLATNHHVIEGAREVRIKLFDGTEINQVELLAINEQIDLALLRIDPEDLGDTPISTALGDSEAVQVGEPVSVIGNPLGLDHTLTNGIVSARRVYEGERYIQMSAPISPGNSGGPVFDRHGRVIGVSVAQMVGGQNLNLAVPVSQLRALVASDYPNRRSFGASSW